jgi:uncharacterized protein (TIGR03382 family)
MGGTVRWTVVFRPTRAGANQANLEITHAGGTTVVPLDGFGGVDPPDAGPGGVDGGNGFETSSYYACKCNGGGAGPGGAAPLLLAFAMVLRRRRR